MFAVVGTGVLTVVGGGGGGDVPVCAADDGDPCSSPSSLSSVSGGGYCGERLPACHLL